jgi:hypothetical protein
MYKNHLEEYNVTYQQENEHERREYSFSPDKLTRNTKYSEIMKVRRTASDCEEGVFYRR